MGSGQAAREIKRVHGKIDMQAAQNQHYVPKFILRNFLLDDKKEQVAVFDKKTGRHFVTSIKNIMAERRFNEFQFQEALFSFEEIASQFENTLLPVYRKILEVRRLDGTSEQQLALAVLVAFQFVRTKAHRDILIAFEEGIRQKVEAMGGKMEDLEGWEPQTEDVVKREHLAAMRESLQQFVPIIAQKDFVLAEAAQGRSFYLGDNPVAMHNDLDMRPYGNIGLALKGIQIYLPLSADLMLAAWCPSILSSMEEEAEAGKKRRRTEFVGAALAGRFPIAGLKNALATIAPLEERIDNFLATARAGRPIASQSENMDFFNSLQVKYAQRYIVCQKSDFQLAKRFVSDFPQARGGFRPRFD